MLNRQETSPFRWSRNELEAIVAIQPKARTTEPFSQPRMSAIESESQTQLSQHDVDTIFLSSIAAIFIRSEPNSFKFDSLIRLLRGYFGDSKVQHQPEEIDETQYNKLPTIQARPAVIAAMKADASLLFNSVDEDARFKVILELLRSHEKAPERIDGSEIGTEVLFRGNDVMANLDIGNGITSLFKPPSEIQTKTQLFDYLVAHFEQDAEDAVQPSLITMDWKAAEALYAARENVGVTQESTIRILMQRPDRAFLFCYLFGTKDPSMPPEYQATARKFESIYQRVKLEGDRTPEVMERLRGWTPEHGAKNPEKVNGGFQGDTIFFQELLFESIDGIHKASPEFEGKAATAVALVRGEPVLFMDTLRKLADILSRIDRNLPFPENETTLQWREVQDQLADVFSHHPQRETIFSGRWFDASPDRNPNYHIDVAAIRFYVYAHKALLLPPTMLQ